MSGIWEKVGFGVVWTIVGAGATALGSSTYFTERHKGDTDEITYLSGRVHDLENKNDELRKEAGDSKASSQAASDLVTCRAQLEDMRRVQTPKNAKTGPLAANFLGEAVAVSAAIGNDGHAQHMELGCGLAGSFVT